MGNSVVKDKFSRLELVTTFTPQYSPWKLYDGVLASTGHQVSVFHLSKTELKNSTHHHHQQHQHQQHHDLDPDQNHFGDSNTRDNTQYIQNGEENTLVDIEWEKAKQSIQNTKILRHPSMLHYTDSLMVDDEDIYIATEPVKPLEQTLYNLTASEIKLGIYQIAKAIQWLHEDCQMTHNNVCFESIFVTKDKQARWVLGDLRFVSKAKNVTRQDLRYTRVLRHPHTIPPEEKSRYLEQEISLLPIQSHDAFAFATLIQDVTLAIRETFHQSPLSDQNIMQWNSDALNEDPQERPTMASFGALDVFNDDVFVEIMTFFDVLQSKPMKEKKEFFSKLRSKLSQLPTEVIKKRIICRMLSHPFIMEPAASEFLPFLFTPTSNRNHRNHHDNHHESGEFTSPSGILRPADYEFHIAPFVDRAFHSVNRGIRIKMLQNLPFYIPHLEPRYVSSKLLEHIVYGLKDTNDEVVKNTLDGLVAIAGYVHSYLPEYSDNVINNRIANEIYNIAIGENGEDLSLKNHALSSLVYLWAIPSQNRGIIVKALRYYLFEQDCEEMKLEGLNVILKNIQVFSPQDFVSTLLPFTTPFLLHESSDLRSKARVVITGSVEYVHSSIKYNLDKVNEIPKPIPVSSVPPSQLHPTRVSYFQGLAPKITIDEEAKEC